MAKAGGIAGRGQGLKIAAAPGPANCDDTFTADSGSNALFHAPCQAVLIVISATSAEPKTFYCTPPAPL
jgi:hypothetical protein